MNNVKLLADLFIAATALSTPFFHSTPAADAKGLKEFLIPHRTVLRHVAKARKLTVHALTYTVTATAYQAVPGQTDSEPFITADNSRIKPHYGSKKRWMALSRDLLKPWGGPFNFGDKVRVRGISFKLDGVYTIHDTMNRRHHHCMDEKKTYLQVFEESEKRTKRNPSRQGLGFLIRRQCAHVEANRGKLARKSSWIIDAQSNLKQLLAVRFQPSPGG